LWIASMCVTDAPCAPDVTGMADWVSMFALYRFDVMLARVWAMLKVSLITRLRNLLRFSGFRGANFSLPPASNPGGTYTSPDARIMTKELRWI